MATYVPGAKQFVPNLEPFTPDYKFLSDVLQTKETRYSTNLKQLNDIYGKVVYGDLSREDTSGLREQFASQLTNKLEQVSGLDLSLAQNVEAAKAIFQPFYDNNLIVKDLVYTAAYRDQRAYADLLQNSPDKKQRDMWWSEGIQALQYQMEDFINASPEEALRMGAPTYTPDADLATRTYEYLKEQGFTVSRATVDPNNPEWIITTNTGEIVTQKALEMATAALADDPMVINAYHTDAYVRSRRYADEQIALGNYTTVREAREAWAKEKINEVQGEMAARLNNRRLALEDEMYNLKAYGEYIEQYGIKEGTPLYRNYQKSLADYEAAIAAIDRMSSTLAEDPAQKQNNSFEGLMNRAYNLMMGLNIEKDIISGVNNYMVLNEQISFDENPYVLQKRKFEHDWAIFNAQTVADQNLAILKAQLEAQGKSKEESEALSILRSAFGTRVSFGGSGTTGTPVGIDEGDYYSLIQYQYGNLESEFLNDAVQLILDTEQAMGKVSNNQYKFNNELVPATEAKQWLLNHPEEAQKLFEQYKNAFLNSESETLLNGQYPNIAANKELYANLFGRYNNLDLYDNTLLSIRQRGNSVIVENFNKFLKTNEGQNIAKSFQEGVPSIIDPSKTQNVVLTQEEYINAFSQAVKNGSIDREYEDIYRYGAVDELPGYREPIIVTTRGQLIRDDAIKSYRNQMEVLNYTLSGSQPAAEGGSNISMYQQFSPLALARNIPTSKVASSEGISFPTFSTTISPFLLRNDPQTAYVYTEFAQQMNNPAGNTLFNYYDANNNQSEAAKTFITEVMNEIINRTLDEDAPYSGAPLFTLSYMPGFNIEGGTEITDAAYRLTLSDNFLEEYASTSSTQRMLPGEDLQNFKTITVTFPQSSDININAASRNNASNIFNAVNFADNNYHVRQFADGGKLIAYLNSENQYILRVQPLHYDTNTSSLVDLDYTEYNLSRMNISDVDNFYNNQLLVLQQIANVNKDIRTK